MHAPFAWLVLSLWAATPSHVSHEPPAKDKTAVGRATTGFARPQGEDRIRRAPGRTQAATTSGQPASQGPQMQSKRALGPLPSQHRAVALWPLLVDDADVDLGEEIQTATADAIDALPKHRSISPRDVAADVASQGEHIDACDRDMGCMARLGRMARAHLVLEMRLVPSGGITRVYARLIDTEAAREVLDLDEPLAVSASERAEQMRRLVVQFLTPADYVGSLQVRCDAAAGQIFLDGIKIGDAPLPPLPKVGAGVHILKVVRPGHSDVHRFIDVQFGRANIYTVHDLDDKLTFESVLEDNVWPEPPPKPMVVAPWTPEPYPSWRTWTAAGLAGAGALSASAGGYLAYELRALNREQAQEAAALLAVQLGDPKSAYLVKRLDHLNARGPRLERGQWMAVGAGAGLIGVGAMFAAWDWLRVRNGALPAGAKKVEPPAEKAAPFLLVPTWVAGRMGLQLNLRF